jgi:3-oxoacyl-[acyl-carrier protein] reductase
MDLGLSNKKALVLGASRGLGGAIARALAEEGATVTAAARSGPAPYEWMADLPDDVRARVKPVHMDVAHLATVDAVADALLAEGGVDILVNNSGGPPPADAMEAKRGDWIAQFEAMAVNLFHVTQKLLPPMIERKWGRVITVASSGVEQPIPRLVLSNGIRNAIVGWSKTLSNEVAAHGVTVNMVLPGRIDTARLKQLDKAAADRQGKSIDEIAKASLATIPAGRYGTPKEFGDVVAFLASDKAGYITGSKIRIDGGAVRHV